MIVHYQITAETYEENSVLRSFHLPWFPSPPGPTGMRVREPEFRTYLVTNEQQMNEIKEALARRKA